MAGLCEGGNEPPGSLKATERIHILFLLRRITPMPPCRFDAKLLPRVGPPQVPLQKPSNIAEHTPRRPVERELNFYAPNIKVDDRTGSFVTTLDFAAFQGLHNPTSHHNTFRFTG
ncbi:hypothetical protein ANN_11708 [Periplaneta americana]|uniref:Uncharacterized protein n=1 Tax=Periplaneta americana TaxID=6978 RepID=A0ABQ8T5U0_PERAM|nr:hypothetical protein ANN_11708 [Periplaneta americana]